MRYLSVYRILFRNSLIREMSFKANFLLWSIVELLWFAGQLLFIEVLFSQTSQIGSWNKWQMIVLIATHQITAQLFQAFCYLNVTQLPELVRTGKLDVLLTLPLDAQFLVSSRQFGFDNLLNAVLGACLAAYGLLKLGKLPGPLEIGLYLLCLPLGAAIHYSLMFSLSTLSFWILRAQGLVYGYFNLFNMGRYPESIFRGGFKFVFSWLIPVLLVANIPARILTQMDSHSSALSGFFRLSLATAISFGATRLLWLLALRRYSSASS